jgi:hypothetical protein
MELAGLALATLVSLWLVARFPGGLSVQSWRNLRFAERASLARSLDRYGMLRPPLYPSLLWVACRAGLEPFVVTALLQAGALAGVAALARRRDAPRVPVAAATAYAVGHFCAVNLSQFTSEALVAAGLPALALLLARHRATGHARPLLAAGALAGLLGLARLFAAAVALPALAVAALLPGTGPPRRRLGLAAAASLIAFLPLAAWLGAAYAKTGYLTGADRTAGRVLPPEVAHWRELTGLDDHLLLTGRTLLVDFFSPDRYAALSVVTHPHRPSAPEWVALALLAWALLAGLHEARRARTSATGPALTADARTALSAPGAAASGLLVLYLAATLALWTLSNNDPIYTRFLFPAYGLAVSAAFAADAALARRGAPAWVRRPLQALLLVYVAAQLSRHLTAEPLPARYEF